MSFENGPPQHEKRERVYQTRQLDSKLKNCVYCNKAVHKSKNCNSVTKINKRQKNLSDKIPCFNCTGTKHRVNKCKSKNTFRTWKRNYYASICETSQDFVLNTNERNR